MSTKKNGKKESVTLREKKLANGNISLYLDIYRDGKRSYEFLKLYITKATTPLEREVNRQTRATAQAIKAKRQIELQNNEYGFNSQFKLDTPFLEYYRHMCNERAKNQESKSNYQNWFSCLKHLERYCSEDTTFRDITPEWIEGFKSFLNTTGKDLHKSKYGNGYPSKPLAQNSKVSYFNKLRACINKAFDDRIIPINPLRGIEGFKTEETGRVYLTFDEVKKLANTPCKKPVLKRAFLFSCLTGLRKSDIERLRWRDVENFGDYTRINFKQKKTGGREYLDISDQAVPFMGERGNDNDLVFSGFKYSAYLLVELSKWCIRAGIKKDVTFHTGRHTFAVLMITEGVDLYTVSKLLGHKEISTTQIYAKVVDKVKQEAVNRIPSLSDDITEPAKEPKDIEIDFNN
ncbi:site-specific integrase [Lascolabacillus massiliensis]|uniref:site-specific integrase n=1 Tax=Lascolabacillus massiliensis TaxID=1627894 RepID=UPI0006B3BA70|nr:site-specific integrase [Lascolabacillus massiliensis]